MPNVDVTKLRALIIEQAAHAVDEPAVLLSGGLDSATVLFSLLEAGKRPVAYSFMLDGKLSTDFSRARYLAAATGVVFHPILLPTDPTQLLSDVVRIVKLGCRKKSDIECTWPRLRTIEQVVEQEIWTGDGADGYFGVSRKAVIQYRKSSATLDAFHVKYYDDNPNFAQTQTLRAIARRLGRTMHYPWADLRIRALFAGVRWAEVNRPRQKQPMIDAFADELRRYKYQPKPHVNLQLGDSGIADLFNVLRGTEDKSVVKTYNRIVHEVVG